MPYTDYGTYEWPPEGSGSGSSPLTTKGDIFGFDTADARIPVGPDGDVLTADSSAALGVSWQPSSGGGAPYQQVPTGLVNNVNTIFNVAVAPNSAAAFSLYLDGLILDQGVDYNLTGPTQITMAVAPMFGQTLYAVYTVVSGGGAGIITALANTPSINLTNTLGTLTADVNDPYLHTVDGTRGAPTGVTAVGGVVFVGAATLQNLMFVEGSGGPVVVTANPQISPGSNIGQKLDLIFRSNVNTLTLADGNGLDLNGTMVGDANSVLSLVWTGAEWTEISRRG